MAERPKIDLGLTGYDELFMDDKERQEIRLPRIHDIPLDLIDDYAGIFRTLCPSTRRRILSARHLSTTSSSLSARGVIGTAGSVASAFPLSHSPRLFISLAVTELREKNN